MLPVSDHVGVKEHYLFPLVFEVLWVLHLRNGYIFCFFFRVK